MLIPNAGGGTLRVPGLSIGQTCCVLCPTICTKCQCEITFKKYLVRFSVIGFNSPLPKCMSRYRDLQRHIGEIMYDGNQNKYVKMTSVLLIHYSPRPWARRAVGLMAAWAGEPYASIADG